MTSAVSIAPRGSITGQVIKALVAAKGDPTHAYVMASGGGPRWADAATSLKALVDAMSTPSSGLISTTPLAFDFRELLRPLTVLGRLSGLVRVPFNCRTIAQNTGAGAAWVGETLPIPSSKMGFAPGTTLGLSKIAGIGVFTRELARHSDPSVEVLLGADLAKAIALVADRALLDPLNTGLADIRPAAITYGATAIASTGSSLAQTDADLGAAVAALNEDLDLTTATWVLHPRTALFLSKLRGTGGALAHPGMGVKGGQLLGLPAITSSACVTADSPPGRFIALIVGDQILVADDGAVSLSLSEEAAIQMDSVPSTGATSVTSFFQSNLVGMKATREINWQARRAASAAIVTGVTY